MGQTKAEEKEGEEMIPLYCPYIPKLAAPYVMETIMSSWINTGPKVEKFEEMFRNAFNFRYALAVDSGTSALRLAYAVAGIGYRDEVITTPWTMVATNTALLEQGAVPVFADIKYESGNIDPADIERKITKKTKAIVVVHVAGYPCDMDEIWAIGFEHGIPVIEDCAHAIGAEYGNHYVGYASNAACFSFQAIKQITTGDGGMFVTVRKNWAEKANRLRWFGMDKKTRYNNPITELGFKYNMNDIAATMGIEAMKEIHTIIRLRRNIAKLYRDELDGVKGVELMEWKPDRVSGHWTFPIHVKRRERFFRKMKQYGIGTGVMFRRNDYHPIFGGFRNDLPNTEKSDMDVAVIPLHLGLSPKNIEYIVETIKGGW